jgi:hypothetical protein
LFACDDVVCGSQRYIADEKVPTLRHTNEIIGAYITAGARIHLYSYLDRLKQMALYCDTDSVIYIQPDDQPALIKTGDCLGGMKSELKPGLHIDEVISGGPKKYAYKTINPAMGKHDTVYKARGITLNYSASILKFDAMPDLILRGNESDRITVHTEHNIKRKRAGGRVDVITKPGGKMYRMSFFKTQASRQYIRPFGVFKRTLRSRHASHEQRLAI